MVLSLATTGYVQTSQDGTPAVFLSTDSTWITKADLLEEGNLVYNISGISFIFNEISNLTGFVEKPVNFLDENETLLGNVTLGSPDVVSGKKYLIRLRYKFVHNVNGTIKYGETNNVSRFITSPPVTPSNIANTIRAEDSGISINISSLYTYDSPSDGYDPITTIRYYVSKVGGDGIGDLTIGEFQITNNGEVPEYNEWHTIHPLTNGVKYEVAYRVANGIAESGLSETVTITPSDLPSEIITLKATNNFNDFVNNNTTLASTSIIKFYWAKPSDYDTLKSLGTNKPVTKYTIKKQELTWNDDNSEYESVGAPVEKELPHDVNVPNPQYELANPVTHENNTYHYVYSYQNEASDFGKIFEFSVFASNSNGDGPESVTSNKVASYINPSLQNFELLHQTEERTTIGTPVHVHNGKLDLRLTTLSDLNGMSDLITYTGVAGVYETDGETGFKQPEVEMKLVIESTDQPPTTIFSGNVTFKQQYSVAVQTFNFNGSSVEHSVGTLLDEWLIDDIATTLQAFFGNLVLGTKYKYTLYRLGKDPISTENTQLQSIPTQELRTHFQSPTSVSMIQAYAVNDDFTPVLFGGQSAIRVLFEQITNTEMNGTDVFINETNKLEYEIRSNSQPIAGIPRIDHSDTETTRQFVVPSTLGTVNNLYVRVYIKNTELDLTIEGEESSPAVQESSKTYPSMVSDLNSVVNGDGTSVEISWTKQNLSGLGGFSTTNIVNRVYLYDETNPTNNHLTVNVDYSVAQTVSFNITVGSIYKIYVLSVGKYTKENLNGSGNKFDNSEIRLNYVKTAITAVGTPGKPSNVEVYPGASKVTFNYDETVQGELRGNNTDNFMYHFILNSDPTYFPYQNAEQTLVQASVANVSGSDEAVVVKAYNNVADSGDRSNAVDLAPQILYKYAVYIISNVGNEPILNVNDELESSNGTALTLVPVDQTPQVELMGEIFNAEDYLLVNNDVPTPEISATAGEGQITVSIKKPVSPPGELVIVLDNNDALDKDGEVVPVFSTINVRDALSSSSGGLFALENAGSNTNINNIEYGPDGYDFRVVNQGGVQTYFVTIKPLVNGRTHNVQVRFGNSFGEYDFFGDAATLMIAAEAPPTEPVNPTFDVDSKVINLSWDPPLNSGGAGLSGNSSLLYEVTVLQSDSQVLQVGNISDTFLTINTSNFPAILDGTTYSVKILAYYIKNGNEVKSAPATIPAVKPNVAPESPSVVVTRSSNKLEVTITTVNLTQSTLYPLSDIQILYKKSNEVDQAYQTAKQFTQVDGAINDGSQLLQYNIISLLNGELYDVKIVATPSYNFAQTPADVLRLSQIPFGNPDVLASIATKPTGNQKALDLAVNLNGSGNITQIIALGKSSNSTAIGILNLSSASDTLPTITTSGVEDVNQGFAANQRASFRLDFGSTISSGLNDAIIIVNTVNGSDAGAYSLSQTGSQYFVDGLVPVQESN